MDVERLMELYGIWAVLFASCFEGELVIVLSGIAAKAGLLPWPWVIAVGWFGTFSATQVWFLSGRYAGEAVLAKRPHLMPKVERAKALIDRWGLWVFVFYRFLYGLRTITPFAIGLGGASTVKFVVIDGLSWLVWLGFLSTLGYIFGDTALAWLETIMVYQKWLFILFVIGIVGFLVVRWMRNRQTN